MTDTSLQKMPQGENCEAWVSQNSDFWEEGGGMGPKFHFHGIAQHVA
mgnify:CR=1 FL=1